MDYQVVIDWVDDRINQSPGKVILAFLVVTAVFTAGFSDIETESGQEQFIEDLPSFEALEDIRRDFGDSFSEATSGTTVILDSSNALSKAGLVRTLRAQKRLEGYGPLRVEETNSPAESVARRLDPNATSYFGMIEAVRGATPDRVVEAVRSAADEEASFDGSVSEDFNRRAASASAVRISVTHSTADPPENRDQAVRRVLGSVGGDFLVIGDQPETNVASLLIVLPAALIFIVLFLVVAYRDPVDLALGLVSIAMTLVWTFGFLGVVGIPFSVLIVSVPPLLIAVGIDFGIHAVNRYREERVQGKGITESMRITTDQLLVAFFIVTGTSAIGFFSNVVSAFPPVRDFGIVAGIGIVFTFLIFGVFLPAGKVFIDRLRERGLPIPQTSDTPLGSEDSALGSVLGAGVSAAERAPILLLVVVVVSTGAVGVYASGVGTGFDTDDFLPSEETPDYLQTLPEPFRPPAEYEYVKNVNFRDRNFDQTGQVLMYVEGPMRRGSALEQIQRAGVDPPSTFESDDRQAESDSVVSLIRSVAERDPSFEDLVRRNDADGDGVPDSNLGEVYDSLSGSAAGSELDSFVGEDRRSARVVYTVDDEAPNSEITEDAYEVASRYRYEASPTGFAVIFEEATRLILRGVVETLVLSLTGAAVFLVLSYWVLEGRPELGVINVVPILTTVTFVVATMRFLGIDFNVINGSILAITIGLGIDYSVHAVHRFGDELRERELIPALRRTVVGTGGALTGSMLTTVFGVGVLSLALNPALAAFGVLTATSVFYAYLTSMLVLPVIVVSWDRIVGFDRRGQRRADTV